MLKNLYKSSSVTNSPNTESEDTAFVEEKGVKDLPDDFPIYEGAQVSESSVSEVNSGLGLSVILETSDLAVEVFDFYKQELNNSGWSIENVLEEGNSYTLSFNKNEITGFLGVTRAGDKTIISVTMRKAS